jgi:hypothetical protein
MMSHVVGDRLDDLDDAVVNRRAAFRHAVSAPVRMAGHEGEVRNLSTRGLYFVGTAVLPVGALVELDITLPDASPSGPLNCRVTARVLRVEEVGGRSGVAAEIEAWRMPELDAE